MNPHDEQYRALVTEILGQGTDKGDRTGTGTRSLFARSMKFDLQAGFPLLTLKQTPLRWIAEELFWFIAGPREEEDERSLNEHYLRARGVDIWKPWAAADGSLGPVYGAQWRSWPRYEHWPNGGTTRRKDVDQLKELERTLQTNPDDRRMIVSAWNVGEIADMALPPCHLLFQCYSRPGSPRGTRYLDMQMYQRSCDMFLGVPFNVASYALFTHLLARSTAHQPGVLTWVGGDCHLYNNHFEQAKEMIERWAYPAPLLDFSCMPKPIQDYHWGDIRLIGYESHGKLSGEVAV